MELQLCWHIVVGSRTVVLWGSGDETSRTAVLIVLCSAWTSFSYPPPPPPPLPPPLFPLGGLCHTVFPRQDQQGQECNLPTTDSGKLDCRMIAVAMTSLIRWLCKLDVKVYRPQTFPSIWECICMSIRCWGSVECNLHWLSHWKFPNLLTSILLWGRLTLLHYCICPYYAGHWMYYVNSTPCMLVFLDCC